MDFSKNNIKNNTEEEEEEVPLNITCLDNNIYFYEYIEQRSALRLRVNMQILINKQKAIALVNGTDVVMPINLYINSCGGEVSSALAIVDLIRRSPVPIHTIIEGEACSSATLISIVGHKRFITENSHMLIHQVSGGMWGKMAEFEDEMKNIKTFNNKLIKLYKKYTNLSEDKINRILKKDISWASKTCLKHGMVDEII
tara:strand:+ start:407 stop:1003 length:597 start_codon:yes stop_codon:yes gene_type:complete